MKSAKKIVLLGLVIAMVLMSMVPAFALPGNTVVIGDKAFSLDYFFDSPLNSEITSAINGGGDIYLDITDTGSSFKDAWTGAAITAAQKAGITNIDYLGYNGTRGVYANFDDTTPVTDEEITVVGTPTAVNATTIAVTFSDNPGTPKQFTVAAMSAGPNTRTIPYLGKNYTVTVTYTPPPPARLGVKEVLFDNFRHFQVVFTGEVDLASAKNPANYYFFINEGDADYKLILDGLLDTSNQLDTLGAALDAKNVNGKTVVDIYLPEDARFTNVADFLGAFLSEPTSEVLEEIPLYNFWHEFYGFDSQAWIDDEQSIVVNMSNDVHGDNSNYWALTAGRTIDVAVRNVADASGKKTIDTAVLPMLIKDATRPAWQNVYSIDVNDKPLSELFDAGAVPVVPVYTDDSEKIRLQFSEPVFDTHGLGVANVNNNGHYKIEVAVDDRTIATTDTTEDNILRMNLNEILKFYMAADDSYDKARLVDMDIKKAIERAYSDGFRGNNTYDIKITGITDLAGNMTNPQVLEFKVSLHDRSGSAGVQPRIIDVKQIHDNVFRVYMNRKDVIGTFEIRNADGEDGLIEYEIGDFPAFPIDGIWYRDIYVPAVDMEKSLGIGVKDDQLLAYDSQNTLVRTLRIFDVADSSGDNLTGDSYERVVENGNGFVIKKDINAPEVQQPDEIAWTEEDRTGHTIVLDVKDIVPDTWATDEGTAQPVYAMLYDWNFERDWNNESYGKFDRKTVDTAATELYNLGDIDWSKWSDLLPIKVSYTKDGVERSALVSNRCISEEGANYSDYDPDKYHFGFPGSIVYDCANQKLIIDLKPDGVKFYSDLLDEHHNLIQGAEYKITIPEGYFADQARFNAYNFKNFDNNVVNDDHAFAFVPEDQILYVSDGRNNNAAYGKAVIGDTLLKGRKALESFMVQGYRNQETDVYQHVGVAPTYDAVPQTSKELINWDEDNNVITVEFTGNVDKATAVNPANYVLNDKTLAQMGLVANEDIIYRESDKDKWNGDTRKFAVITLPYDTISVDGDYTFKVSGVAHPNGAKMTPVEVRLDIDENFRPVIERAVVIGENEIELTFNEPVRYAADPAQDPENSAIAAKDNFVVEVDGAEYTPMSATIGTTPLPDGSAPAYPLNKVVRLYVGSVNLLEADSISVDVVKNQNNTLLMKDSNGNPLNDEVDPFVVQ